MPKLTRWWKMLLLNSINKLNRYFVLILFFSIFSLVRAQDNDCFEPKKKAVKIYEAAKYAKTFEQRYSMLRQAIEIDPNFIEVYDEMIEINLKKASKAFEDRAYKQFNNRALQYLNEINDRCPSYRGFYASIKLGDYYYNLRKFNQAKQYYIKVLNHPKAFKKDQRYANEQIENIEEYYRIINNPVPFNPQKVVGPSSLKDEYLPMLSPDNKYLFFTRKTVEETKDIYNKKEVELFVKSRQIAKGKFSSGIPMPKPFNLGQFQGGVSVSVDNKLLFVTIVELSPYTGKNPRGKGQLFDNADIYYSEYKDGSWTQLQSVGNGINTGFGWEGQPSITADNKTLYFTKIVDPYDDNQMDIYKSERQPDGSWGKAENVGPPINTPFDEKSPFMHSDSYTLYFSSNGHIGVGGMDIFYAKMDEQTGTFNKPINLGVPINTEADEHGFIVSRDGDKGYFGSSDGDNSDLNIFSFDLYEEARPEKVVFVEGSILNNKGEVPEDAKVLLKNTRNNKEVEGVIDQNTGEYVAVMAVKDKEDIMLTAKKKGYAFSSQLITSNEVVVGKPIKTNQIEIKPIEVGEAYKINDINFATNSYEINTEIMFVLNEFIDFLKENPTVKVDIHGHTDNVGDPEENMFLSENRAKAVYNYLVLEDIDSSRLSYKGFGETKPIASNSNEVGRAKNRRTEFVIVSK